MSLGDRILKLSIVTFCIWQASDLVMTWSTSIAEQPAAFAFLLWLLPAIVVGLAKPGTSADQRGLLSAALILTTLGQVAWVNALQHIGLILALSSAAPNLRGRWGWVIAGALWLPASGWLCTAAIGDSGMVWRLAGSAITCGSLLAWNFPVARLMASPPDLSKQSPLVLAFVAASIGSGWLYADTFTYSPVQSPARPFGLEVVDLAGLGGSDDASTEFLGNALPGMQELIDSNLGETNSINGGETIGLVALDPSKLTLAVASDVRAYFVGEGAGYHNTFGFNTAGGGIDSGDPLLIFPDASSPNSYLSSGGAARTVSEPLMPGDFVELGSFDAGTHLDFFLIANGANGGTNLYSTDQQINPDGIAHVVTFSDVASPYLLIGFEDLFGGGDEDYNDLLVALYVGEENVQSLLENAAWSDGVPAPEPGSLALVVLGFAGWLYRRRTRKTFERS